MIELNVNMHIEMPKFLTFYLIICCKNIYINKNVPL